MSLSARTLPRQRRREDMLATPTKRSRRRRLVGQVEAATGFFPCYAGLFFALRLKAA
jgi:hypothetical protein